MYRRIILSTLAYLVIVGAQARTLELIEGAHEAVLGNVTFPSSTAGLLIVRGCPTCEGTTHPVDADTQYFGTTGRMTLAEFQAHVAELRQAPGANQSTAVGIFYSLDNLHVTRVSLHLNVF